MLSRGRGLHMQSLRYIAFCIKKFEDESFYGKYISSVSKRAYYLTKYNIHQIAKFTIDFSKGKFGFFYYAFSFNSCYAVGCRSPPNQSKPKKFRLIGGNNGEKCTEKSICFRER